MLWRICKIASQSLLNRIKTCGMFLIWIINAVGRSRKFGNHTKMCCTYPGGIIIREPCGTRCTSGELYLHLSTFWITQQWWRILNGVKLWVIIFSYRKFLLFRHSETTSLTTTFQDSYPFWMQQLFHLYPQTLTILKSPRFRESIRNRTL